MDPEEFQRILGVVLDGLLHLEWEGGWTFELDDAHVTSLLPWIPPFFMGYESTEGEETN